MNFRTQFRIIALLLALAGCPALSQDMGSGLNNPTTSSGSNAPCTAFGTTAGTCAQGNDSRFIATPVTVPNGGTGNTTAAAHSIPVSEGTAAQAAVGPCTTSQVIVGGGASADPACGAVPAAALPAATISTQGAVVSGCTTYTPTDQSGSSITFSAATGEYCIDGPAGGQTVSVFFSVTYPTIAVDANVAKVSLPVAVPNQSFAQVGALSSCGVATCTQVRTIINTSTVQFVTSAGITPVTNAGMSLLTARGALTYPVQ